MATNVTIFHDGDGNIHAVIKDPAPATPAGLTALAKVINDFSDVHNKRVRIGDNALVDRDFLEVRPAGSNALNTNQAGSLVFQKVNGDTLADMTAASDDEKLQVDLRSEWNDITDIGYLRSEDTCLVNGASSVCLAAPSSVSSENIVLYNSTLKLFRINVSYG